MDSFVPVHRRSWIGALLCLVVPVLLSLASAPQQPQGTVNRYIGAAQCKLCHQAKNAGDQYGVWAEQKHSKAYATLASDRARSLAKEKGIADPQKSEQCLKCHVTAFDRPKGELHGSFDATLGVQCESCHGPGEKHKRARMAAAGADDKGKPGYATIPDGEIIVKVEPKTCTACHNPESPSHQPFCFHKAAAQVRHLNPSKPRTDAEKAALTACHCDDKCVCRTGSADGKCSAVPPADGKSSKASEPKK